MKFLTMLGRNDPCRCGSGKKYKKCCLPEDEKRVVGPPPPVAVLDHDPLDDLSNCVLDLVRDRRFEQALSVCERLLRDYPDVVDGLERSALVHEKMGNCTLAASFYRKAFDFVAHPSRAADYEDADWYRQKAEELEGRPG